MKNQASRYNRSMPGGWTLIIFIAIVLIQVIGAIVQQVAKKQEEERQRLEHEISQKLKQERVEQLQDKNSRRQRVGVRVFPASLRSILLPIIVALWVFDLPLLHKPVTICRVQGKL